MADVNDLYKQEFFKYYEKYAEEQDGEEVVDIQSKKGRTRLENFLTDVGAAAMLLLVARDRTQRNYTNTEYQDKYYKTQYTTQVNTGAVIKPSKINTTLRDKALNNPLSKLSYPSSMKASRNDAIRRINQTISSALQRGESPKTVAKEIDKVFGFRDPDGKINRTLNKKGETYKSLRVARTEMHRVQMEAQYDAADQLQNRGMDIVYEYVATLDNRTRPQSASMDGQLSNDGEFIYPNGQKSRIGQTGNPAYDINDRCTFITRVDDIGTKFRRAKDQGIIKDTTFNEWAKTNGLKKNKYGQVYE